MYPGRQSAVTDLIVMCFCVCYGDIRFNVLSSSFDLIWVDTFFECFRKQ